MFNETISQEPHPLGFSFRLLEPFSQQDCKRKLIGFDMAARRDSEPIVSGYAKPPMTT